MAMSKIDVNAILSNTAKKEARESIKYWVKEEISNIAMDCAHKYAKEWAKTNEEGLRKLVFEELDKRFKQTISRICRDFGI